MALIYRYHIKYKDIRRNINLIDFSEEIRSVILEFYKSNLKDYRIEKDYYEYRLYVEVENSKLREFGKKLIRECYELGKALEEKQFNKKCLFIRMMNEYYAFINTNETSQVNNIELIDARDFNDLDYFTTRSKEKLHEYFKKYNVEDNNKIVYSDEVARAFYMDVYTMYMHEFNRNLEKRKNSVVLVKGYHRKSSNGNIVIPEVDVYQLRNLEEVHESKKSEFQITSIKNISKDQIDKIAKSLDFNIKYVESIKNKAKINYEDINFTVHNVGQALATALSISKDAPFLYFDFGVSEGVNEFNRPEDISIDVSEKPSIVISHIHRDHWYGLTIFTTAFESDWYIPTQSLGMAFKKRCAEIIASGGSVNYINQSIDLGYGTIFISKDSKHKINRESNSKHDKGLAMKLKLYSKQGNNTNILVSGDQTYDYMPQNYLDEIDILVASHHGGEYSWSVYNDIPNASNIGLIIYSYGEENTYNHPSKVNDYALKGWVNRHNTVDNSDYIFKK